MLPSPSSPVSPGSSTLGNNVKPARLRTACSQCCSAKVKCSGERTGCERCSNLQARCIYMESRVGKVPGTRAKKRHITASESVSDGTTDRSGRPSSVDAWNSTESSSFQGGDGDQALDFLENDLDTHLDHDLTDQVARTLGSCADMSNQITGSSNTITNSIGQDFRLPDMNFNLDEFLQPFPGTSMASQSTTRPRPIITPTAPSQNQTVQPTNVVQDSQFVLDCAQIISDLENYIVAELKSFKIVLGLVKRALEKISQLNDMQQQSRSMRCMILLTAIMYQITELLVSCFDMLCRESNAQQRPSFSLRTDNLLLPGLGLGEFGMDKDEHNAWRNQMMLKVVNQASEALRRMKKLATMATTTTGHTETGGGHGRSREQCYVDLEMKLSDLTGRLVRRETGQMQMFS